MNFVSNLYAEFADGVFEVNNFVEKPAHEVAVELLSTRNYLWNASIFVFQAKIMIEAFAKYDPETLALVEKSIENGSVDIGFFLLHSEEWSAFVPGEYIIGLLANVFLEKEQGAKIVHDPRVVWNTRETVLSKGGNPIVSKTGHAFIKATMRENDAIYGGEMSAHHYFRDFAYCDSGMIPWLLIWELISKTEKSLGALLTECRENFPSSGEQNFKVTDATRCLNIIRLKFQDEAERVDELDGVSMEFKHWRFNVRKSNTEPLVRLNVETRGDKELLSEKVQELIALIRAS